MTQNAGFLFWWYMVSPKNLFKFSIATIKYNLNLFSIKYLFRTLFSPWKRDILMAINPSFVDQIRVFAENLVSRFFGFIIRLCTIIVGIITTILSIILLILLMIIWFSLPLIIIGLLYFGIRYLI
ncbi:MAG: hypothetical protein M1338_03700 [Patescibacteria group bacterium]|nr:hypothetical protein [Patescibacteria group bacterium]